MSRHEPQPGGGTTSHEVEIAMLRYEATKYRDLLKDHPTPGHLLQAVAREAAAALLETHDTSGISLDEWKGPRELVEFFIGESFLENHV
jgi:hypothetical protein